MFILNSASQNNIAGCKGKKGAQITLNQPRYCLPTLYLSFSQEFLYFFYRESRVYKGLTLKDETTKALLPLDYNPVYKLIYSQLIWLVSCHWLYNMTERQYLSHQEIFFTDG